MFAVVVIGGKQYKVSPGDVIDVDKISIAGQTMTVSQVLLVNDDKKVTVGTPTVSGAKVTCKVIGQFKGEKIHSMRFKSKVRVRKRRGFRSQITRLEVLAIS